MVDRDFEGRGAVVTGAGVGIGYEIARQLALHGARVLLNDVSESAAQAAADQIRAEGGECVASVGDVADVGYVRGLVSEAVQRFGRVDAAVCNAGLTLWGDFFAYEPDAFDRVMAVNLRGSFFLTQAAARQMREQGEGGRVLLMASVAGIQSIEYLSAYAMSKAALQMLARNLVAELSPHGITVNCVAPGATVTPRNLADDPHYERSWGGVVPLGAVAYPQDIAHAALFLLHPRSAHINGQTITVDGGWTAISPTPSLDFVEK